MKTSFSQCNNHGTSSMPAEVIGKVMFAALAVCLVLSMAYAAITSAGFRDIVYQSALDGGAARADASAFLGEPGGNASSEDLLPISAGSSRTVLVPSPSTGN